MKKKLLAAALAVSVALAAPFSASAAWEKTNDGQWQWTESGKAQTGWAQINETWYHFDEKGIMSIGWLQDGGTWYYLTSSGAMAVGWQSINGNWYYFDASGAMATGWRYVSGNWYYMDASGAMATGWRYVNGNWYYMNASGAMQAGWVSVDGKRYFLERSGAIQSGLIEVDGDVYYLDETGAVVTGTVKIDGKRYEFAETGESIGLRTPQPEKAFDGNGNPTEITVEGGLSGGAGGGGSSGGSGSGSGSGSSGGSGNESGGGSGEEPSKPKKNIGVTGGTYEDTEEGIRFNTNEGTYLAGKFTVMAGATGYYMLDGQRTHYFRVNDLTAEPSEMTGEMEYYPEGVPTNNSANRKRVSLSSAALNEETGILTLTYSDLDVSCTVRLRISENRKSVTVMDLTSDILDETIEGVWVTLETLPDTTAIVRTEQELRDALVDESINKIVMTQTNGYNSELAFTSPLIIERDIEITNEDTRPAIRWSPSDSWDDEGQPLIIIQGGANVRFTGGRNWFYINSRQLTSTLIEVRNATLELSGVRLTGTSNHLKTHLHMENAIVRIYESVLNLVSQVSIEMDTELDSVSKLEFISGEFNNCGQQITSGSPDSTVLLPNGFVEFTNEDGQREWTNDPDKIASPPQDDTE